MKPKTKWNLLSLTGWMVIFYAGAGLAKWVGGDLVPFLVAFMAGVVACHWFDFCSGRRHADEVVVELRALREKISKGGLSNPTKQV